MPVAPVAGETPATPITGNTPTTGETPATPITGKMPVGRAARLTIP